MDQWKKQRKALISKLKKAYDEKLKVWQAKAVAARKTRSKLPGVQDLTNLMTGLHRPANLYNGVLNQSSVMVLKVPSGIRETIQPSSCLSSDTP